MAEARLKIAVFIDFDNIEIGVKSTLNAQFDIGIVLEALKERGEVVSKTAYGDWTRAGDYSRSLTQHATKLVQRNLTPGGDKNGADINLALDALEMAFTHPHINAYVIVGGDSDFISLVEKLKQYDKQVFVVGGRSFTSQTMQRNCHEFIAYENLVGAAGAAIAAAGRLRRAGPQAPIEQAMPLVRRALKVLADREVTPQLGLLKSTLLQLDSTFSERNYGVGSFRDFAQKLANAGFVTLREHGRNVLVELKEDGTQHGGAADGNGHEPAPEGAAPPPHPARARGPPGAETARAARRGGRPRGAPPVPVGAESAAVADVRAADEAVPPRRGSLIRRTELRILGAQRAAARVPARRAVPDGARSPGGDALLPGQRHAARRSGAGGTPESEAEAQIRHGREAAAAGDEPDVVEADVVQEIDATPPVIDVSDAGTVEEPSEDTADAQTDAREDEAQPRGRRKRAAKPAATGKAPRPRKPATRTRSAARRKTAVGE